ncbi:von willebrand factor type A domain protein (macronuclear) [Tetrahymena thermophila SB210]|uniref:von willebrand factor type A domain protein n=1 Tax=Tetrahymena thermophila (strain SB210) TaxID=312017 RepID=I7M7G1_TETTS|nr:von willebrand factor type A domain protein [Tetrahymena thermophila SB210]EAR92938.2 von willebrand factor type A domain protein [Tetrahymena thermophila SB210]|eukprot:XP_001013183.2 von willebrand factor type A domain protein [Tetrahymena thermophila SB210]
MSQDIILKQKSETHPDISGEKLFTEQQHLVQQDENAKSNNIKDLQGHEQKNEAAISSNKIKDNLPSNNTDMLDKIFGVKNLKNSLIQGSVEQQSSNNSSIIGEEGSYENILQDCLHQLNEIDVIKNDEKNQHRINDSNEMQDKETNTNLNLTAEENANPKVIDATENAINMLLKRAYDNVNLSESSILQEQSEQQGIKDEKNQKQILFDQFQNKSNDAQKVQIKRVQSQENLENKQNSQSPSIKLIINDAQDSTPQSLYLETKESIVQDKDNNFLQGNTPESQDANCSNFLSVSQHNGDNSAPNVSLFAQMTKQQNKKDMKNWAFNKSFVGRGSGNLTTTAIGANGNNLSSMSSFVLQKKVSMQHQQGGLGDSKDFDQLNDSTNNSRSIIEQLSESVPASSQPKKTLSLIGSNKKNIKITNTTSKELKKYNFQDDDIIKVDIQAYQKLAQSFNISQNITISTKTMLSYQLQTITQKNLVNHKTVNPDSPTKIQSEEKKVFQLNSANNSSEDQQKGVIAEQNQEQTEVINKIEQTITKKIVIPVLLSVKTEEQMISYQYFDQLDTHPSQKDIHSLHQIDQKSEHQIMENIERQRSLSIEKLHEVANHDEINENKQDLTHNHDSSGYQSDQDQSNNRDITKILDGLLTVEKQQTDENTHDKQPKIEEKDQSEGQQEEFEQNETHSLRKISQKKVLIKSIQRKVKTNKEKVQKALNEEDKENQTKSQQHRISSNVKNISGQFSLGQLQPMRFPIDLICVIDTSGSMNGQPLDLLKETLLFLVDLLQTGDRICLIQFSTNAQRLTPLLSIESKDNIKSIKNEINRLVAKGGTNICQGMQLAFDVLKQRRYKNPITSVFLLSDGLNDGAENKIRDLLKQLNFYQNYNEENFTIQTFGFGKDHDPNLMDKISQLMDGNFYYIGDIHRIDECFIDALGGLFSVISQNVSINVQVPQEMREQIRIVKTYGDIWHTKEPYYEYSININQLLSGVSKDYILEMELDSKLIEDLQCIHEIHSEEEIQSSENIGSNKNFDLNLISCQATSEQLKNSKQSMNILEAQLIASNMSLGLNNFSASQPSLPKDQLSAKQCQSQSESESFSPDLMQREKNQFVQIRQEKADNQCNISSGAEFIFEKYGSCTNNLAQQAGLNSQSELSQQSMNTLTNGAEEAFASSSHVQLDKKEQRSIPEMNSDQIIKKDVLNLQNHRQIQENLVKLHYLRVKGAEGLEKCQALALQKKFDEGNEYVSKLLQELNEQPEETKKHLQKLILDLTEAQDTLSKKVGEQIGWHRMISCKRMHMEQRSAGTDLTYQNSVQKIMVQRRKSFKDQNSIQSLTETITKLQSSGAAFSSSQKEKKDKDESNNLNSTSSDSSDSDSDQSGDEQKPKQMSDNGILRKKKSFTVNPSHSYQSKDQQDSDNNNCEEDIKNNKQQIENSKTIQENSNLKIQQD